MCRVMAGVTLVVPHTHTQSKEEVRQGEKPQRLPESINVRDGGRVPSLPSHAFTPGDASCVVLCFISNAYMRCFKYTAAHAA